MVKIDKIDDPSADLVILTYREIFEETTLISKQLALIKFTRIIFDEIHELVLDELKSKSTRTHFSQILATLKRQFTWGITGTPGPLELYANYKTLLDLLAFPTDFAASANLREKSRTLFFLNRMRKSTLKMPTSVRLKVERVHFSMLGSILYTANKLWPVVEQTSARELCSHYSYDFLATDFLGLGRGQLDSFNAIIEFLEKYRLVQIAKLEKAGADCLFNFCKTIYPIC